MKTLMLILLPMLSVAQMPMDEETKKFTYQEVIELPGQSKDQVYLAARSWFVQAYRSADDVIQMEDKEQGRIIGKGVIRVQFQSAKRKVRHTVQIDVKDGKYRYTITDFILDFSTTYSEQAFETLRPGQFWGLTTLFERTDEIIKELIAGMKKSLADGAVASDDW